MTINSLTSKNASPRRVEFRRGLLDGRIGFWVIESDRPDKDQHLFLFEADIARVNLFALRVLNSDQNARVRLRHVDDEVISYDVESIHYTLLS